MRPRDAAILATLAAGPITRSASGEPTDPAHDHVRGVDVSSVAAVEDAGGVYTVDGALADPLAVLRDAGANLVRLRVWHDPADGCCDTASTLERARRADDLGLATLIDLHYSDTWADPGQQTPPAAWDGLGPVALRAAVRDHTGEVVGALVAQGTTPSMVQVGNEIAHGFLWDAGAVDPFDDANWDAFADLLRAAVEGVRDAEPPGARIGVVVHLHAGGDNALCRAFLDRLVARGVAFDAIGLSYYPWWHGTIDDLEANIADLRARYGRRVLVVETAYPFTLGWNDHTHNAVGRPGQLHPGYDATPEGQAAFLERVFEAATGAAGEAPGGVIYWGGELVSAPALGSSWENLALFGFDAGAMPALGSFDRPHALDLDGDGVLGLDDLYHAAAWAPGSAALARVIAALRAGERADALAPRR